MTEDVVRFGDDASRIGILTRPEGASARPTAVLLLNSGIVHRVGPNRLYVRLARRLAATGFPALRFDFSGIGDSAPRRDGLPFEASATRETGEAMDAVSSLCRVDRFVLLGICSGAAVSLQVARRDPRVVGAVLVNGRNHLHGEDAALTAHLEQLALARHYWRVGLSGSFLRKNLWKALTGRMNYREALRSLVRRPFERFRSAGNGDLAARARAEARELERFATSGPRLLLLHAEGDEGLDYVHVLLGDPPGTMGRTGLSLEVVPGANHTFTPLATQRRLLGIVTDWLSRLEEPAAAAVTETRR